MRSPPRRAAAVLALALVAAAPVADPDNPTCPREPGWGGGAPMAFYVETVDGRRVLVGDGAIDGDVVARLTAAVQRNRPLDEIRLRSRGGDAAAGNAAGRYIRTLGLPTRVPAGWACFSACNFLFMGGPIRFVDPGGLFIVHMFTHLADRQAIATELGKGTENAIGMIGDVEQDSAMLASDDNDFLIRMGVSRKLLTEVMYRQRAVADGGADRSTRRCLTQDELFRYNVANAR